MLRRVSDLLLLTFSVLFPAYCQNASGRIEGVVTDPGGAVVAGASVTVTNTATGVRSQAMTGADGAYQVPNLPIGSYTVMVEKEGFSRIVTSSNDLTINQTMRVDVQMRLESVS